MKENLWQSLNLCILDHGLHYIEGDDEGYTTEQINEFIEKYREYQQYEDEAMKMIKVFFPQCERGELNTGDYPF